MIEHALRRAVIDSLQRYFAIEEILSGDSGTSKAPRLGNRWLEREDDGEVLAQDLRQKWQIGIDPIPNMTASAGGSRHQGAHDVPARSRLGTHLFCVQATAKDQDTSYCCKRTDLSGKAAVYPRPRTCTPANR